MTAVPWWALSPSPFTILFWTACALYGASQFKPNTLRQWLGRFGDSAFILGLVVLPFDAAWQILQWKYFGYFAPNESFLAVMILIRDSAGFLFCLLMSRDVLGRINLGNLAYVSLPIWILFPIFLFAPSPAWTDITYGFRFGDPAPLFMFVVHFILVRSSMAYSYYMLWRIEKKPNLNLKELALMERIRTLKRNRPVNDIEIAKGFVMLVGYGLAMLALVIGIVIAFRGT